MYPDNIYWHLQYFQYRNHVWFFSEETRYAIIIILSLVGLVFSVVFVICVRKAVYFKRLEKSSEIAFNKWKRCQRDLEEWIRENPYKSLAHESPQNFIYKELASLMNLVYLKSLSEVPVSNTERERECWLVKVADEAFVPSEF